MDARFFKGVIAVITDEQERRALLLSDEDPNLVDDQWLFRDLPFVNELCLMLLVALRHQVERELVGLAARASDDGKQITGQQYWARVRDVREQLRRRDGWKDMNAKLSLESCGGYESMEALRLLANSWKHDPSMGPDQKLLRLLKLKPEDTYAQLPESLALQKGLAVFVGLNNDATYCDIAGRLVDIADGFLVEVQNRNRLSAVKRGPIPLNTFAH